MVINFPGGFGRRPKWGPPRRVHLTLSAAPGSRGCATGARIEPSSAAAYLSVMSLRLRTRPPIAGFIEPCLPRTADRPPAGPGWLHEIKHDGYRLLARKDAARVRLITRRGIAWTERFPLIAEAASALPCKSCLIDGEAVACDDRGLADFQLLRRRGKPVILYAFDLLQLDGEDLRGEPIEKRKAALAKLLRKARPCWGPSEYLWYRSYGTALELMKHLSARPLPHPARRALGCAISLGSDQRAAIPRVSFDGLGLARFARD